MRFPTLFARALFSIAAPAALVADGNPVIFVRAHDIDAGRVLHGLNPDP